VCAFTACNVGCTGTDQQASTPERAWHCLTVALAEEECPIPHCLKKERRVNWIGMLIFLIFLGAFGFYIYARMAYTLGLGGLLW
jgi:hypothetical protein